MANEASKLAKIEAEKRKKYEDFLAHMMFELSEMTALVFYPWVFVDEEGRHRDKYQCPPYIDLTTILFKQNFDIAEEQRLFLTEEAIEKMFVESGVEITKELVAGAPSGRILVYVTSIDPLVPGVTRFSLDRSLRFVLRSCRSHL